MNAFIRTYIRIFIMIYDLLCREMVNCILMRGSIYFGLRFHLERKFFIAASGFSCSILLVPPPVFAYEAY